MTEHDPPGPGEPEPPPPPPSPPSPPPPPPPPPPPRPPVPPPVPPVPPDPGPAPPQPPPDPGPVPPTPPEPPPPPPVPPAAPPPFPGAYPPPFPEPPTPPTPPTPPLPPEPPPPPRRPRLPLVVGLGVLAAAAALLAVVLLGGDDDDATGLDAVEQATVRIDVTGTFRDPAVGSVETSGHGTGFVIDETGIAVTNNHVVGGAGTVEVKLAGEERTRNAKILGLSECSDLAVIDIDGDGFQALEWSDDELAPGRDVYAAGFPLGNDYNVSRGTITKADSEWNTVWASVDHVIEHRATINPGNSGGPLVTPGGEVVGVNYATVDDAEVNAAISRDEALPLIEQLRAGRNVNSIGVNGTAVADEDADVFGVWVSAVEAGSPADEAGIQAGDVITQMAGVGLAKQGTMKEYCEVLRSRDAEDPFDITVLRFDSQEVLEGQINGDELELAFSFAREFQEDGPDTAEAGRAYTNYRRVEDDTERISVEVPASWSDVDGSRFRFGDGDRAPSLTAAPDLGAYGESYDVPGMQLVLLETPALESADALLDGFAEGMDESCRPQARQDYDDLGYVGKFDQYLDCGGSPGSVFVVAAGPARGQFVGVLIVQVVTAADADALDHILSTFTVR